MIIGAILGFGLGAAVTGFVLIRKYEEEIRTLNRKIEYYQETTNNYIEDNFGLMNEIIKIKSNNSSSKELN